MAFEAMRNTLVSFWDTIESTIHPKTKITALPDEVLAKIFSGLETRSLVNVAMAIKHTRRVVFQDDDLYREYRFPIEIVGVSDPEQLITGRLPIRIVDLRDENGTSAPFVPFDADQYRKET